MATMFTDGHDKGSFPWIRKVCLRSVLRHFRLVWLSFIQTFFAVVSYSRPENAALDAVRRENRN